MSAFELLSSIWEPNCSLFDYLETIFQNGLAKVEKPRFVGKEYVMQCMKNHFLINIYLSLPWNVEYKIWGHKPLVRDGKAPACGPGLTCQASPFCPWGCFSQTRHTCLTPDIICDVSCGAGRGTTGSAAESRTELPTQGVMHKFNPTGSATLQGAGYFLHAHQLMCRVFNSPWILTCKVLTWPYPQKADIFKNPALETLRSKWQESMTDIVIEMK